MRSTKSRSPSTSRRICSGFTLKREKISLMISSPSRRTPRRMCSDSMTREPSFEASYRAKKSARRAFSLYFSNMGLSLLLHLEDSVTACRQIIVMCNYNRGQPSLRMTFAHHVEDPRARFEVEITRRFVREEQLGIGEQRPRDRHALLLASGKLIGEVAGTLFQP